MNKSCFTSFVTNVKPLFSFCVKNMSGLVPNKTSVQFFGTAFTKMRFCGITESYFQIFLFLTCKIFRDTSPKFS